MHQSQASPGIGIAVVEVESGVEIFQRQFQLVDLGQALAARQIRGGNKRIAVDGGIEIIDGGLPLALPLIDQPPRMHQLRRFGLQADRIVQIGQCLVKPVERAVEIGAAQISRVITGIGGDGIVEIGHRLVIAVGLPQSERAIGIGFGEIGVERNGLREIGYRLFILAGACIDRTTRIIGHRIVRAFGHHFGQRGDIGGADIGIVVLHLGNAR